MFWFSSGLLDQPHFHVYLRPQFLHMDLFSVLQFLVLTADIFAVLYPVFICLLLHPHRRTSFNMLAKRLYFTILMFLTTPAGTPEPITEGNTSGTRKKRCPGCQRTHDDHTFGHPSKNCQGPISPPPSPTVTGRNAEQGQQQRTPRKTLSLVCPRNKSNSIAAIYSS